MATRTRVWLSASVEPGTTVGRLPVIATIGIVSYSERPGSSSGSMLTFMNITAMLRIRIEKMRMRKDPGKNHNADPDPDADSCSY